MSISKMIAVAAVAGGIALASAPAFAGHHCVRAGASATAVTSEIAGALAKEALYQSNAFAGRKARGAAKVSCKYVGIVTTCTARQVACK
jgi:hypothetical protein